MQEVFRISLPSTPKVQLSRNQRMEYSCHWVTSELTRVCSCRTIRPASRRRKRETGLKGKNGIANKPGAKRRDGMLQERKVPAKKPLAGILSCSLRKDNQFGGEACMNQVVCGRTGNRPGLPPKPSESPKGSFQRPKPQVPGKSTFETRARRLNTHGGACFRALRRVRA